MVLVKTPDDIGVQIEADGLNKLHMPDAFSAGCSRCSARHAPVSGLTHVYFLVFFLRFPFPVLQLPYFHGAVRVMRILCVTGVHSGEELPSVVLVNKEGTKVF